MPILQPKPRRPQIRTKHPLSSGLRAFYSFNEGTGSVLRDLVQGDTVQLYGGPTWTASPYGPALSFNGSSQYGVGTDQHWVGTVDPNRDNFSNDYAAFRNRCYGVVFASNSPPATSQQSIFTHGLISASTGIRVGLNASSYFGGDSYTGMISGTTPVVDTTQWHVGLVSVESYWGGGSKDYWFVYLDSYYEYSEFSGYNGSWDPYALYTFTGIQPQWGNGLQIARRFDSVEWFNGQIAAIVHWDRLLGPSEISNFFNDPFELLRVPIKRFLFAPAVSVIEISPDTVTETLSAHAPTVTLGAKVITPATVTPTLATHAPSMAFGAKIVAPAAIAVTAATHAPSMTLGAQTITPATVTPTLATHAPAVTGGAQTLQPTAITGTATHSPTVTRKALSIAPTSISSGSATYSPSVILGGQSANPTAISGTATHPPTITRHALTVSVGTIASGSAARSPSVSFRAIPITPLTIFGTSLFGPDLFQGVKQIAPTSIGSHSQIFSPLVRGYQTIGPATIPSGIGVSGPSLVFGDITVSVPSISATTQVNPLTIFGARRGPTTYLSITIPMSGVPDPYQATIELS